MSYVQLSEGGSRRFTPLACGPGSPELSKSYMGMARKNIYIKNKKIKNIYIYTDRTSRQTQAAIGHSAPVYIYTVVARHNMMVDAWRRVFARAGISSRLEPHVKQLLQRLRAAGLPTLPS